MQLSRLLLSVGNVASKQLHHTFAKNTFPDKFSHKILVYAALKQSSSFSTSQVHASVWPKDWAHPVADAEFYRNNPPVEGETMYVTHVTAAPTRFYFSTFHDPVVEKFEKMILKEGKGAIAYKLMRETLRNIKMIQVAKYHRATDDEKAEIEVNPLVIFHQAIQNGTPMVGMRTFAKSGAAFKVPYPLTDEQKFFHVSKCILNHCRDGRPKTPLSERLAKELMDAYNNEGYAVKRKQDMHREAERNRAFAHIRWT